MKVWRFSHHSFPLCSSQIFSIVIFGCIANEGYVNRPDEVEEYCIFNRNQNACNYAVGMGSLAFLCCAAFMALDVYFPQISSVKDRKKAVLADIGVSGKLLIGWSIACQYFISLIRYIYCKSPSESASLFFLQTIHYI